MTRMATLQPEDPNLILTLKAESTNAARALRLPHNKARYIPPMYNDHDHTSRETTPEKTGDDSSEIDQLVLRFDQPPGNISRGFVFGTEPDECDVLLGERKYMYDISRVHFRITFDENGRVALFDCHSRCGTSVSYDNFGAEHTRKFFKWLLLPGKKFKVHLPQGFTLAITIGRHHSCEAEYEANLSSFLCRRDDLAPTDQYMESRLQSRPDLPRQEPIYLPGTELGEGSFGKVRIVTDVSTGVLYAAKEAKQGCRNDLESEAQIMELTSHDHIVRYHYFTLDHSPQLVMEYLPLGNLEDQQRKDPLTEGEICQLLVQALDALMYLHSQSPPITHRDIKPENILVQGRGNSFHIKLSDFGLATALIFLKTRCGSPLYKAPEADFVSAARRLATHVQDLQNISYDSKVDIWSLGVVILECVNERPLYGFGFQQQIADTAEIRARNEPWNPLLRLLKKMLQMDPSSRPSAAECHEEALAFAEGYSALVEAGSLDNFNHNTHPSEAAASATSTLRDSQLDENRTTMPHQTRVLGHYEWVGPNQQTTSAAWNGDWTTRIPRVWEKKGVADMLYELRTRGVLPIVETEPQLDYYINILAEGFSRLQITELEIRGTSDNRLVMNARRANQTEPFELSNLRLCEISVVDLYGDLFTRISKLQN
ncbi:hypothetical protein FQN50_001815 [Emmonsiellopsis sp. PD_5]|nr:hypothetical protein FQN50_001815 [Emmonsiellopsis sp. PD_5]